MSDVQLLIDGKIYSGWKAVSVRRSLDLFADTFDLTLTDTEARQARTIRLGAPCQVRVDGERLITGYIDRIRPQYDAKERSITVSGRSRTADLVDCSLPAGKVNAQINNQNLLELARLVARPFNISVHSEVADLAPIRTAVIGQEETPFEFLETHARQAAVMLVSDPDGNLVITRASSQRIRTPIVLGENVEEAEGEFSERDRYSHYFITGQMAGWEADGEAIAHISGESEDLIARYRPTVVIAEGPLNNAEAKRRAQWQRNVHYGRSRRAVYTVTGWRHADDLWRPNRNVLVRDEWMGFVGRDGRGEWLMIGTVEFVLDARGRRTRLTVMPREAYDLVPLPAEDGGVW